MRAGNSVQWFIRDRNGADVLIQTVDISGKPFAGTNTSAGSSKTGRQL